MADIEKRLNKAALKIGEVWGTEINCNYAEQGILPLNAGAFKQSIETLEDESAGSPFQSNLDLGNKGPIDFSLDFDLRYEGLENLLVAQCMGTAGDPAQQEATAAEMHTFKLKNTIVDLFSTYVTEKHDKFHVVPSVKVQKLTYTIDAGKLKLTVALRGNDLKDDSIIITSMANVTAPDIHNQVLGRHLESLLINAESGSSLAAGDEVKIKNFTLDIERMIEGGKFDQGSQTIRQAKEEGKVQVTLTLDMHEMDDVNDLYLANWAAGAEKKAVIQFKGAEIVDPYYYRYQFKFPRLKIIDVDYPDEAIIPATITMRALYSDVPPSGMTGINHLQIYIMNKRSTDYLLLA